MATFADLDFTNHNDGPVSLGVIARIFFPNGYGASVIRSKFSYGGDEGLYELAVLEGDVDTFCLTYATPVTTDVLGHLSEADVTNALGEIKALPPASRPPAEAVAATKAERAERMKSIKAFLATDPLAKAEGRS